MNSDSKKISSDLMLALMKAKNLLPILVKELLFTAPMISLSLSVSAQGTVFFENLDIRGVNAPVYESDAITKLSGSQFTAELLGGPSASSLSPIATTGFLTGAGAGYFNGHTQAIPGVPGGADGWAVVLVWNTASGASFDLAQASGLPNSWWQSPVFSVHTGNPGVNPTTPGALTGLGTSPVYLNGAVPEPSTFILLGLGIGSVIVTHYRRGSRPLPV